MMLIEDCLSEFPAMFWISCDIIVNVDPSVQISGLDHSKARPTIFF
jgi:hypothetical protein